jgi:hypothetical protein
MANKDGWSRRFDEPILLEDSTKLTTLREAIEYLAKTVPKAERNHPTGRSPDQIGRAELSHVLCTRGDATSDPPAS